MAATDQPRLYPQQQFSPPSGACEILLVRHGESAPVVSGKDFPLVDGHGDPSLSQRGHDQAALLAARLRVAPIAAIYVTNLRRTHETAAPVATELGMAPIVEPDLREVYLGEWEGGLFRQKVAESDPIAMSMWAEGRWDVIPGAETNDALRARTVPALARIATNHPDSRVMVVAHGGVIGTLLAHATGGRPFAFVGVDNASISNLVIIGERWILRRFNDTGHLEDDLSPGTNEPNG